MLQRLCDFSFSFIITVVIELIYLFPYNYIKGWYTLDKKVQEIFGKYHKSFKKKTYSEENNEYDVLMNVFNISPELKRENRQYWGRELGMLWQLIVTEICSHNCDNFQPALRINNDEPVDLRIGNDAIDTKYRIGSGDSGTLKKFKQYGQMLRDLGYNPILLILRTDNLPNAISACHKGGWTVLTGQAAFNYLYQKTGIDVEEYLEKYSNKYPIY